TGRCGRARSSPRCRCTKGPRTGRRPPPRRSWAGTRCWASWAAGAMGVVYRARDRRLNRLVALKMILAGAHAGPKERARFEAGAPAAARLQHPHIVQIHDIGEQDGRPFLCLELVEACSLAQKLQGRALSPDAAARLTETLARAVQHAHEQGIVR